MLTACEAQDSETNVEAPNAVEAPPAPAPVLPIADPVLDRVALLGAVAQAASAFAADADDGRAQAKLDGRRFALKLRFGCDGPAAADSDDTLLWRVKSDTSLEIRATPDLSFDAPALAGFPTETVEAVEGFWIARPWLLSDRCPAPGRQAAVLGVPRDRSVGIAQYYTDQESRVERRSGRAYVSTMPLEAKPTDQTDGTGEAGAANVATPREGLPTEGMFLSVEGRLRPWPGGRVIRCTAAAINVRPTCIVSVKMDRVAFINPASGEVIDEWHP